ncbi:MAG: aldehyde dehydrogenase family protein [Flavobacteriales bacterium]|nr:aldehyde dehydrogenase family protein [Flavobacteriales bacterium]
MSEAVLEKPATGTAYSALVQKQRDYFWTHATKSAGFRKRQLNKLKDAFRKHEKSLLDALWADLHKPEQEAFTTEIEVTVAEIDHYLRHLDDWMEPERVATPLFFQPGSSMIVPEPYGVTLIIAPWNYPVKNLFGPLLGAMAAGNTAVVKPSEISPNCSKAIADLIKDTFDPEYIVCVEGGVPETGELLKERFDYLLFTGGTEIGRIVYQAAAKHLTPVTLELGGKSPCIIDTNINVDIAAKRLVWGKFQNAGQTCIAPDYIYVNNKIKEKFLGRVKHYITEFFGPADKPSEDLGRIISDKHFNRVSKMLTGDIIIGGVTDASTKYIAPTVIDNVSMDHPSMQEEIFGPVMPIIGYDNFDEVVNHINAGERPLAMYLFSNDSKLRKRLMNETSSGAICVNETMVHAGQPNLPFGGVGNSGMGAYNGKLGFDTFSHKKPVMTRAFLGDVAQKYPPYTTGKTNFIKMAAKWLLR